MLKTRKPETKAATKAAAKELEKGGAAKSTAKVIAHFTPVQTEIIAERAFRLFETRGCVHGYDVQDWLEAERQLSEELLN